MNAYQVYVGSDGEATQAFYAGLEALGPVGQVAVNVFRAQKCSERAKTYSRRYRGSAYDRKQWSMENLCTVLEAHAGALGMRWGWKEDPQQEYHRWVLYVELPTGQVSFHTSARGKGPDYPGDWDGKTGACPGRIVAWVQRLVGQ